MNPWQWVEDEIGMPIETAFWLVCFVLAWLTLPEGASQGKERGEG